jgi:hypothetical protein
MNILMARVSPAAFAATHIHPLAFDRSSFVPQSLNE